MLAGGIRRTVEGMAEEEKRPCDRFGHCLSELVFGRDHEIARVTVVTAEEGFVQ